ncbi:hypothetical protein AWENTII_003120 [Aspergillus wentii]
MATIIESPRSSTPVPGINANDGDFRSPKIDIEAQQTTACSEGTSRSTISRDISSDHGLQDNSNVPRLSLPRLFWFFFYNFGLFALGAQ